METFLKVLDPEDATTGGGSASAIAGAMAGSLVALAARLSGSAEDADRSFFERITTRAGQLSQRLLAGSEEDARSFQAVHAAYQLPRQSEAEKTTRRQAVQSAWFLAASVPLENAGRCLELAELGLELLPRINPRLLSDLRCGLLLAGAGLGGCLENVQINLPSLKDAAAAGQLAGRARELGRRFAELEPSIKFTMPPETPEP